MRMRRRRRPSRRLRAGLETGTKRRVAVYLLATGGLAAAIPDDAATQPTVYTQEFDISEDYHSKLRHIEESGLVDNLLAYDFHIRAFNSLGVSFLSTSIDAIAFKGGILGEKKDYLGDEKKLATQFQVGDTIGANLQPVSQGGSMLGGNDRAHLYFNRITTFCDSYGQCSRHSWAFGNFSESTSEDGGYVGYYMGEPGDIPAVGAINVGFTAFTQNQIDVSFLNTASESFTIPTCDSCAVAAAPAGAGEGQTTPGPRARRAAIPLALLSLGAAGTIAWRRRAPGGGGFPEK